ncbi:MAG: hypothetical protein IKT10_00800 [Clostridiales bacterium]|nr:hypothetical protein [Clostridiales bacterium]
MKRSKKPLTFTAIAASIGALSMAVEGCVYGPPPSEETCVYGPPPSEVTSEQVTDETETTLPEKESDSTEEEVCVYGPPSDQSVDNNEVDVYGPPPGDIDE